MKLYTTPNGSWAGTQDDAKALAKREGTVWTAFEVPTDKPSLIAFLNGHRVGAPPEPQETTERLKAPPVVRDPTTRPEDLQRAIQGADTVELTKAVLDFTKSSNRPADMSASGILSRIDNPGVDVEGIVQTICKARGHSLKRYAGAVAVAFEGLKGAPT